MTPLPTQEQIALLRRWAAARDQLQQVEEWLGSFVRAPPSLEYYEQTLERWAQARQTLEDEERDLRKEARLARDHRLARERP